MHCRTPLQSLAVVGTQHVRATMALVATVLSCPLPVLRDLFPTRLRAALHNARALHPVHVLSHAYSSRLLAESRGPVNGQPVEVCWLSVCVRGLLACQRDICCSMNISRTQDMGQPLLGVWITNRQAGLRNSYNCPPPVRVCDSCRAVNSARACRGPSATLWHLALANFNSTGLLPARAK